MIMWSRKKIRQIATETETAVINKIQIQIWIQLRQKLWSPRKKLSNDVVDTKSFNKADQKNISSEEKEIEKDPSRSANGTC